MGFLFFPLQNSVDKLSFRRRRVHQVQRNTRLVVWSYQAKESYLAIKSWVMSSSTVLGLQSWFGLSSESPIVVCGTSVTPQCLQRYDLPQLPHSWCLSNISAFNQRISHGEDGQKKVLLVSAVVGDGALHSTRAVELPWLGVGVTDGCVRVPLDCSSPKTEELVTSSAPERLPMMVQYHQ